MFGTVFGGGSSEAENLWAPSYDRPSLRSSQSLAASIDGWSRFAPAAQSAGESFSNEYARILLRDALREDGTLNESNQEALESGAIDSIFLQDEEILLRHSYWALAEQIRQGRERAGR